MHCCACAGICGHFNPATFCDKHSIKTQQTPWGIPPNISPSNPTWTYVSDVNDEDILKELQEIKTLLKQLVEKVK